MNIITAAYLAALMGIGYALWQTIPHGRVQPWVGSLLQHTITNAEPNQYGWTPGAGANEASGEHDLTEAIERIETTQEVPALLSAREQREIEDARYAALFLECDYALSKALTDWHEALEPVRVTLKRWHREGRRFCEAC